MCVCAWVSVGVWFNHWYAINTAKHCITSTNTFYVDATTFHYFSPMYSYVSSSFRIHFINSARPIEYERDNYFFLPLLRPLSLCIFIYFTPFPSITFHCLSFVSLTVIHLPGRVHWFSWSVMEISWLLFSHSGRFTPDEKNYSFCANS